jgi:hypothetical protein
MYVRTARYTGPCCLCGAMIVQGQPIDFVTKGRARAAAHPTCRTADEKRRASAAPAARYVLKREADALEEDALRNMDIDPLAGPDVGAK